MRIIYNISATYNSGGMERVLANKANWLVRNGYEVSILTTDQKDRSPFFDFDPRIRFYDLGINYEENNGGSFLNKLIHYPFKQWKHKKALRTLLPELKADVVVSMFCNDASILPKMKDDSRKVLEIHFSRFKRQQYERKGLWKIADEIRSWNDQNVVSKFDRFVVLTEEDAAAVKAEMKRIIGDDLPFDRREWSLDDAIAYFEEDGQPDKVELLKRRPVPFFNMYECGGMWEYFYGAMAPSTGYVPVFGLQSYADGFVLMLPTADKPDAAPLCVAQVPAGEAADITVAMESLTGTHDLYLTFTGDVTADWWQIAAE